MAVTRISREELDNVLRGAIKDNTFPSLPLVGSTCLALA